jgi:hypothetical protein
LEVTAATKSAIDAIVKAGGSVKVVYHSLLNLRYHLYPEKFVDRLKPKRTAAPLKLRKYFNKLYNAEHPNGIEISVRNDTSGTDLD